MHYYRLMCAWKQNDNMPFSFDNAHDLNSARDSSQEESIKAQLRIRMQNSKEFILLIGENTRYLYKFLKWEIEQALARDLPIIAVNLNGMRSQDTDRCPPVLRNELSIYVSFNAAILQHALEHWPSSHMKYKTEEKSGPYYYKESVYRQLGL